LKKENKATVFRAYFFLMSRMVHRDNRGRQFRLITEGHIYKELVFYSKCDEHLWNI
jgi:hypothetical protein